MSASTRIGKPRISRKRGSRVRRLDTRRWWALAAVSLATFMTYLDNNIVNVAIPTIQRSLHLSVSGLEWVVSSYLLTLAGLLLVGGRLADVYGRRRLFRLGLAVFTLSSLAAGLAGSGGVLIASRAVQGVGAALLMPATLAIIMATFTNARERNTAIGIWAAVSALALALGPVARRPDQPAPPLGLDLPHQRADRRDHLRHRRALRGRIAGRLGGPPARPARPGHLGAVLVRADLRADRGRRERLDRAADPRRVRGGRRAAAAVFLAIEARAANPMVDLSMFRQP